MYNPVYTTLYAHPCVYIPVPERTMITMFTPLTILVVFITFCVVCLAQIIWEGYKDVRTQKAIAARKHARLVKEAADKVHAAYMDEVYGVLPY